MEESLSCQQSVAIHEYGFRHYGWRLLQLTGATILSCVLGLYVSLYAGLLALSLACVGAMTEWLQERDEPRKLIVGKSEVHVYWRAFDHTFLRADLRVEETRDMLHSRSHLKFITGGHVFKIYSSINDYDKLKQGFLPKGASWWNKDLFLRKGNGST